MNAAPDLGDCRCVRCGAATIAAAPDDDGAYTRAGALACTACGSRFDRVWGVPFLFDFDEQDFAGLVEIVANAHQISAFTPEVLEDWRGLLIDYHAAADKPAYLAGVDPINAPWLPTRYNEWLQLEELARDIDWRGLKVLDVGAGLGFDAYRHVAAGADVTALEFSPVLAREGARNLPMIRWFGGASHVLPFKDGSFDAVFANAALHHMRDIPAAMEEMLRVLRPGGRLITTGDPYRADAHGEDVELAIFNDHPAVLQGVNEGVPRLCELLAVLVRWRAHVEPEIFTQMIHGGEALGGPKVIDTLRTWSLDAHGAALRRTSGSVALRIALRQPLRTPARRQEHARALRPADLASWMDDQGAAMARLAAWAPDAIVDRPFPGDQGAKIELLNGWRRPTGEAWREGYRRARWYQRRAAGESVMAFSLKSARGAGFEILLNGATAVRVASSPQAWVAVDLDISAMPETAPFAVEIRIADPVENFADDLFLVRDRAFRNRAGVITRRSVAPSPLRRLRGRVATALEQVKSAVRAVRAR